MGYRYGHRKATTDPVRVRMLRERDRLASEAYKATPAYQAAIERERTERLRSVAEGIACRPRRSFPPQPTTSPGPTYRLVSGELPEAS